MRANWRRHLRGLGAALLIAVLTLALLLAITRAGWFASSADDATACRNAGGVWTEVADSPSVTHWECRHGTR